MSHTEQLVRDVLAEIHAHPRRDLSMPHGFEVDEVLAEEVPNMFAPDLFSEQRITTLLDHCAKFVHLELRDCSSRMVSLV